MKTKHLLALGSLIPVIFWGTLVICGYVLGNYNHLTRLVSELGEIGTRSQYIFMAGLLACAVLSVLFVIGLCQACKKIGISTIPALIILSFSLSIGGAAIFPLPLRMQTDCENINLFVKMKYETTKNCFILQCLAYPEKLSR